MVKKRNVSSEPGSAESPAPSSVAPVEAAVPVEAAASPKPTLELNPDETAAAGTRRALLFLFEQMLAQEEGVLRGEDPEALHDFRVAVRRTRSTLGQVRGVFPPFRREKFRESFAWLAGESNLLRDTDVLLESVPVLAAEVLPDRVEDLSPLREHLLAERERAHAALVKVLRGAKYKGLVRSWRSFLEKPPKVSEATAPNAERPIFAVACERLLAVYGRIRKRTRAFEPPVPAVELHELRIECKKLRYLLELFRSLFATEEISAVIAHLKHLQDLLGEMNDCEVQKEMLYRLAGDLERAAGEKGASAPAATCFAMGRLAQRHERRQKELRKSLENRIEELTRGQARAFFRRLRD